MADHDQDHRESSDFEDTLDEVHRDVCLDKVGHFQRLQQAYVVQMFGLVVLIDGAAPHKVPNVSAGMGVVQHGTQAVEGLLDTLIARNMGCAE